MELVEIRARTLELAEQTALEELGVKEREQVEWEILQEPSRGFLGVGRQDAIVRAKRKPARGGRGRGKKGTARGKRKPARETAQGSRQKQGRNPNRGARSGRGPAKGTPGGKPSKKKAEPSKKREASLEKQAEATEGFLTGLLQAIEVPGKVETRSEENLIVAEIVGDEAEMLVGTHGGGIEALHTITKSVIKRKTSGSARLRLDVSGYGHRRREALTIYATGLVEQVQAEGGELMLEPMNAADRKVIHDTVAEHDNVRSFSEGEAPHRYVVLANVE